MRAACMRGPFLHSADDRHGGYRGTSTNADRGDTDMKAGLIAQKFDVAGRLVTVENTGKETSTIPIWQCSARRSPRNASSSSGSNKKVFPKPAYIMENMRLFTEPRPPAARGRRPHARIVSGQLPRIIPCQGRTGLRAGRETANTGGPFR